MLSDTDPRIERLRDQMLAAGPARRFQLMASLTDSARSMSRAALRRRFPDESPEELELRFVALCHGQEFADRLAQWRRTHPTTGQPE